MSGLKPVNKGAGMTFVSIISGTLRVPTTEDDPNAVARKYEDKQGNQKVKYELEYGEIEGKIINMYLKDSDFGQQLYVVLDCNGSKHAIQMNASTSYWSNFVQRLPNVDFNKEVVIRPYDVTDKDTGKRNIGVKIAYADDSELKPIPNFFRDADKKKNVNGFPDPDKPYDEMTKAGWRVYFAKVNEFLERVLVEKILPEFPKEGDSQETEKPQTEGDKSDIDTSSDLPF